MFFNPERKFLIMYIMDKNSTKLKEYIQQSFFKKRAVLEIINLKYQISKLSPLMYNVLLNYSSRFSSELKEHTSLLCYNSERYEESKFLGGYEFNYKNNGVTGRILFTENRKHFYYMQIRMHGYNKIFYTEIPFSKNERAILKALVQYNKENLILVKNFKTYKTKQDIINMR